MSESAYCICDEEDKEDCKDPWCGLCGLCCHEFEDCQCAKWGLR